MVQTLPGMCGDLGLIFNTAEKVNPHYFYVSKTEEIISLFTVFFFFGLKLDGVMRSYTGEHEMQMIGMIFHYNTV